MTEDIRDELREEWMLLQKQYEDFDQRALSLKALMTPLIGAGYAAGIAHTSKSIVVATIIVTACLWALETIWKTFQYCLTDRIKAIEEYFRSPERNLDFKPYQIYTSWGQVFDRDKHNWKLWCDRATQPFVLIPYAPMIVAGVLVMLALL
ncbi:hypothetical protein [Pseudoroseomonas ludipueritiae]|uniref:SMODS and SLOG-associating 2TM effector domain-containing protein n=1 Tax=Pseudoroseomonas ludipueritiae TaxID=198093 RepID=A0ABR7R2F6_9PROT|nr:hypothetical protein [Pseudoroseomonas ludipueritiae]MBC9175929.1 hypothetical protein [Pseudoroseomonas ludipueritiae]